MKKVIRLTESDLTRIVKRVIEESKKSQRSISLNEGVVNQQTVNTLKSGVSSCFNKKDYPNLWALTKGSSELALGFVMYWLGIPVCMIPKVMETSLKLEINGMDRIVDANIGKIKGELGKLKNCITSGTISSIWNFVPNVVNSAPDFCVR
jgi:hypothetical protein